MFKNKIVLNPTRNDCPFFNPLIEYETDFVKFLLEPYEMEGRYVEMETIEFVLQSAITVLKRMEAEDGMSGSYLTPRNLAVLLGNPAGNGRGMSQSFINVSAKTQAEAKENVAIASFFLNEYYTEDSRFFSAMYPVYARLELLNRSRWGRILNPDPHKGEHNAITGEFQDNVDVKFDGDWYDPGISRIEDDFTDFLEDLFLDDEDDDGNDGEGIVFHFPLP